MYRNLLLTTVGLVVVSFCLAQSEDEQTGAKAIYIDSLHNAPTVSVHSTVQTPSKQQEKSMRKTQTAHRGDQEVPAVTGVRFFVELLRPDGELLRVPSHRVFHSGEHIRIHLTSNVNGNLIIYQSENGSGPEILFPADKLPGRVTKETEIVLPSSRDWFVFDEHPGQIYLTMKLTADTSDGNPRTLPSSGDSTTVLAKVGSIKKLQALEEGSKALKIEAGDSSSDPSEVVVVDARQDAKIPPGQIAVNITLDHRS